MNFNAIDARQIEAQFFADMTRYNIKPRQSFTPLMDGKIHRFATEQDKGNEQSGAYKIYPDLVPQGDNFAAWPTWFIKDYRQHEEGMIKGTFNARNLDKTERAEIFQNAAPDPAELKRREAEKAKEAELQRKKEQEALKHAWQEYRDSRNGLVSTHPYCQLKHITESKMLDYRAFIKERRLDGDKGMTGDLMIPYFTAESVQNFHAPDDWTFQTLQFIRRIPDKEGNIQTVKRFYGDTHTKGACLPLIPFDYEGKKIPERILICEGAATGASLFKAFKYEEAVIIAGSCNNYIDVAKHFRKLAPKAKIIIAADHDKIGKDGKIRGLEAANAVIKAGYADEKKYPLIAGADWNDYFIEKGVI